MKSIEITRFKGYRNGIKLGIESKSTLVFGENGAGKTSLYEALKIWFFKSKIASSLMAPGKTPEEREQALNDYLNHSQNVQEKKPFEIKINGFSDNKDAGREDYRVFMISASELDSHNDDIVLGSIMSQLFFDGIDSDFLSTHFEVLQNSVNESLQNEFSEDLFISIDPSDNYRCSVVDKSRNLEDSGSLSLKFNESKIHLIRILLLLHIIQLASGNAPHKLLVLDDFVTSMDAANRAFIIKFIINKFCPSFQLFILTHSAGFYNLCKFEVELMVQQKKSKEWEYYCFYSVPGDCKCYREKGKTAKRISDLKDSMHYENTVIEDLGNELRQLFETLVHKVARRIQAGGLEESKGLINRILSADTVYIKNDNNANNLIDELKALVNNEHYKEEELARKINQYIDSYSLSDYSAIKETISDLKLFQKVALHPSSHATVGHSPISRKELEQSIILLDKLSHLVEQIDIHDESVF